MNLSRTSTSQQASTSTSTSTAQSGTLAPSNADAQSVCEPVNECVADPYGELEAAVDAGDACLAWQYYDQLGSEDQARFWRDHDLQERLIALVYPSIGESALDRIFLDLCLAPLGELLLMNAAGILDESLLRSRFSGWDAGDQSGIAASSTAMQVVIGLVGSCPIHEIFDSLATDPERFFAAAMREGPFADWLLVEDEALLVTMSFVGNEDEWMALLQAKNRWEQLLRLAGEPMAPDFYQACRTTPAAFSWLVGACQKPLPEGPLYDGFLIVFGDGTDLLLADKYTAFEVMYGAGKLARSGQDWNRDVGSQSSSSGVAGRLYFVYHAVDPNDDAMAWFFEQFATIPRAHVQLASKILMTDYYRKKWVGGGNTFWIDASDNFVAEASAQQVALDTSYYTGENYILMQSLDGNGTPDASMRPDMGEGSGLAPRSVNRRNLGQSDASATPDMNRFQNHATHEVGHAVGARPLNTAPLNGQTPDAWTKSTYGWSDGGTEEGYARTLQFTASMDTTSYTLRDGAVSVTVNGSVIRTLLSGYAKGNAPSPPELIDAADTTKFASVDDVLAAIGNHATLKSNLMYRTVQYNGGSKGECFMFPYGVASGAIHFYCTRWPDGEKWVKYNNNGYTEKPSHYAVSSYGEFFAEAYTTYYTGGRVSARLQPIFAALDTASASDFGALPGGGSQGIRMSGRASTERILVREGSLWERGLST